jgi:uncharacterized membrane protein YqaE (UPF0057 family)
MDIFKLIFGIFIPSLLLFAAYGAYEYGVVNHVFDDYTPI